MFVGKAGAYHRVEHLEHLKKLHFGTLQPCPQTFDKAYHENPYFTGSASVLPP